MRAKEVESNVGGGIRLLALGGTISMSDGVHGATPALHASELSERHGKITSFVDVAFLGGSEIDFAVLGSLVNEIDKAISQGCDGVVVTLGTDAIEETAAWISCSGPWSIPIAITGSMLPGARLGSDAIANLSDAIEVASDCRTVEPVVVFGGRIYAAHEALKVSGLERMAFDAPGYGAVGTVLPNGPSWHRTLTPWEFALGRPGSEFPVIPIMVASLGDDGSLIAFAARITEILVIAGNGAGNLPPAQARAAIQAAGQGKLVVVASRAADFRAGPLYGYPGGSATLGDHNIVVVSGLSPHRARIVLSIAYSQGYSLTKLAALLRNPSN